MHQPQTPPRNPGRLVLIGAGPTSLGAAWRLEELGFENYVILEQGDVAGGLSRSIVDDHGFTWDLGGHVQFSHYSYYDRVLDDVLKDQWLWHERESWVWMRDRFIPYPFQYNVHRLDEADQQRIVRDLEALQQQHAAAEASSGGIDLNRPRDFGSWMQRTFGEALCDVFMRPYNLKVWGYPGEAMGCQWIGERVAIPDVERVKRNIATREDDVSWGPNNRFRFPLRGGTGAIWSAVASRIPADRFRFSSKVNRIDLEAQRVTLDDGEDATFDAALSTMPIDQLIQRAASVPGDVRDAASGFKHSSTHVLGFGLRGGKPDSLAKKCWMYFPESQSPYYRITVFSHYSPHNAPEGCWSLMAEVCESPDRPVEMARLMDWAWQAMKNDKLVTDETECISRWHTWLAYGYPTPFLERDALLRKVQPHLRAHHVYSRGRFGGWKYEVSNQDHAFMQGVEWANHMLLGEDEVTYFDPARANSGAFKQDA